MASSTTIERDREYRLVIRGGLDAARDAAGRYSSRALKDSSQSRHATHAKLHATREVLRQWMAEIPREQPGALLFYLRDDGDVS